MSLFLLLFLLLPTQARSSPVLDRAGCLACHGPNLQEKTCVRCHTPGLRADRPVLYGKAPLLTARFDPAGLARYLRQPVARYGGKGSMFALTESQIRAVQPFIAQNKSSKADAPRADQVAAGEKIFREHGCEACHDGKGIGPLLQIGYPLLNARYFGTTVTKGRGRMPAFPLSQGQIQALYSYISLTERRRELPAAPESLSLASGEKLYQGVLASFIAAGCIHCHGSSMHGGNELKKIFGAAPEGFVMERVGAGGSQAASSQGAESQRGASHAVTSQPGTSRGAASQPGTSYVATSQPGTSHAATSQPGTSQAATSQPGTSQAAASQPGTSRGAASQPGTSRGAASQPGTSRGAASQPGTSHAATSQPGTSYVATSQPGTSHAGASHTSESAGDATRVNSPLFVISPSSRRFIETGPDCQNSPLVDRLEQRAEEVQGRVGKVRGMPLTGEPLGPGAIGMIRRWSKLGCPTGRDLLCTPCNARKNAALGPSPKTANEM